MVRSSIAIAAIGALAGCALVGGVDDDYRLRPEGAGATGSGTAGAGAIGAGGASGGNATAGGTGSGADGGSGGTGGSGSGGVENPYRVFVTSEDVPGLLGADSASAMANADTVCADAAASASLGGTWMAWLGSVARLTMSDLLESGGPWYLVDTDGLPDTSKLVAADYADLTDGSIGEPIAFNEYGQEILTLYKAWTATQPDGNKVGRPNACNNWTTNDNMLDGVTGNTTKVDAGWTEYTLDFCVGYARLYCFERAP